MSAAAAPHDAPLAGLRVIDLTRFLPGPFATLHLRRLGADVLKIEDPGPGDPGRELLRTPAQRAAGAPSRFFSWLNEGKRSLRLDLAQPDGRAQLLALVREADLLIEGFRPGVMERLGIGWSVLQAENPRLVMGSISGYGQQGPWARLAGHDLNYIAQSGVLAQIRTREGRPVIPNFQIGDLAGGTLAALSELLAALLAAQRSGRGRHVDVSMTHQLHEHNLVARLAVLDAGADPAPGLDLLNGGAPCYQVYATRDGRWMAVAALELKFWRIACGLLGHPEWGERHWSLGQEPGGADALALQDEVAAVFATRTLAEWTALFEPADCCVTPVLSMEEAMRHPLFAPVSG